MFLSDTGNSEFGQCFPRNLTYQMNPVNLGSFFGVLQGPFEAPPKYLKVKRTLVRIWYLGSLSKISKFFFFFMYVFLFLAVLGLCCCGRLSLLAAGRGSSLSAVCGLLCGAFPCFRARALRAWLRSCGSWALEHRLNTVAHGLVAPWHVGSSQTRGQGWNWSPLRYRLRLFHWAPREAFQKVLKQPVRWNHRVSQWLVKLRWK